jgi:hypothetical protein
MTRCFVLFLIALMLPQVAAPAAEHRAYAAPLQLGEIENELIRESSGLAISRRDPKLLWTHNDSGDVAVVYAFDLTGKHVGAVMLEGIWARDWEDMASTVLDGKPTLVLGDIGDNVRKRRRISVYFIDEPTTEQAQPVIKDGREMFPQVKPRTLHLTYPDKAYDCESLTVDPSTGHLYLITKQYGGDKRPTTVFRAALPKKIEGQKLELTKVAHLRLRVATAADMSADGRRLVIESGGAAYVFDRAAEEDWADALKRPPSRVRLPQLKQGESIAYGADGWTLYLTSEKRPTPLWQIPLRESEKGTPH